jgi:uncharacterized membrane protein
MAKSNRKRKAAIREKKEARKFWQIVGISVFVLLVLLFVGFMNA